MGTSCNICHGIAMVKESECAYLMVHQGYREQDVRDRKHVTRRSGILRTSGNRFEEDEGVYERKALL